MDKRPVMAVSSGGGHWVELLRLRPAFDHHRVVFVTVAEAYRADLEPDDRLEVVADATRWDRLKLVLLAAQLLLLMARYRPRVVVTTGAAPGYLALRMGRLVGAGTVWVDSMANTDELSMSGRRAGPCADLWLTQWEHLAEDDGPEYAGAVL